MAGAASMRDAGHSRLMVVGLWAGATALLAAAVVLGRLAFSGGSLVALASATGFFTAFILGA